MGIDALGYEEGQKQLYLNTLKEPQGMWASPLKHRTPFPPYHKV